MKYFIASLALILMPFTATAATVGIGVYTEPAINILNQDNPSIGYTYLLGDANYPAEDPNINSGGCSVDGNIEQTYNGGTIDLTTHDPEDGYDRALFTDDPCTNWSTNTLDTRGNPIPGSNFHGDGTGVNQKGK